MLCNWSIGIFHHFLPRCSWRRRGRFLAPRAPLDGVPVRPNEIATTPALRVAGGNIVGLVGSQQLNGTKVDRIGIVRSNRSDKNDVRVPER